MMERIRTWMAVGTLGLYAVAEGWAAWAWAGRLELVLVLSGFSLALLVAMVGVYHRRMWARWLAMGAGLTGVANAAVFFTTFGFHGTSATRDNLLFGALSLALLASLGGGPMAAHFTQSLPAHSVWRRQGDPRIQLLAGAIVTSVAAVAMMLVFGAVVWRVGAIMLGTAAVVGLGALLTAAERAAGVVFMGAGALVGGVVALGLADCASSSCFCGFGAMGRVSATFAYPPIALAAATSAAAFAAFAKPMLRFVLRPPA